MKNLINYGDGPRAIYEVLKQQIITGDLEAGKELKILPLAKEMDISIVPLREAIRMLYVEKLVELRPRRSPVIASLDVWDLVEINKIRGALEPMILADAVGRHTAESLAKCEEIVARARNVTDPWDLVELNKDFHMSLLGPSRLGRSRDIISNQYDGISRVTHYRVVAHRDLPGSFHDEHAAILASVLEKDEERAVSLMTDHIVRATTRAEIELARANAEKARGSESD